MTMTSCPSPSTYQVAPNLYLADANIARNRAFLKNAGILGIVNATTDEPNVYRESYEYLRVSIYDVSSERISIFFEPVFDFIQRHHNAGHGVLVHCQMGISRSPTLVIGYLMMEGYKTLSEAFRQVKRARPQIDPNEGFIKQLRELEISLFYRVLTVDRITYLDRGVEKSSNDPMNIVLNAFADLVMAFAVDAPETIITTLTNQLLKKTDNINHDSFTDLVCRSICKCMETFGGSNLRDQKARIGLQQGLSALCTLHNVDLNTCLDTLTNSDTWKDLCADVPLANRWLVDLRDVNSLSNK